MQAKTHSWLTLFLLLIIAAGCKDPFDANIPGEDTGFLVVEGYINVGNNAVTTIKLSRTTQLSETVQQIHEVGAIVAIEDEQSNRFPLFGVGNGVYSSAALSLSTEQRFRISIETSNGKKYYSEFEQPIITPEIDSIRWERINEGVPVYVYSHDANVRYYQWDYEEVWEVRSPFTSYYVYTDNGQLILRSGEQMDNMRTCWKYDYPDKLLTESTAALTSDNVTKQLFLIPVSAEELDRKYAITVRQTALSREAYEYLQLMEKNTNEVGTFSDPQPSELYGNIYHESSDEPVVGFVGASTTTEARIFIFAREVPNWNFNLYCEVISVDIQPDSLEKYLGSFIPVTTNFPPTLLYAATEHCVDCRKRGGINIKPDYWGD